MTRRALVVSSQIEGLQGADRDATLVAEALAARGFAIELRQGADATRAGVLDGLDALAARCAPGDAALFYYAGHGSRFVNPDPRAGTLAHPGVPRVGLFIVPTDYRASTDDDFRGIGTWELSARLTALTARTDNATVVLDCCHAAPMMRDPGAPGAIARALPYPHRLGLGRYLAALAAQGVEMSALDPRGNPHAVRLLACAESEVAMEIPTPGGHRGVLTEAFLWLLDQVDDATVTWEVAGAAIRQRVQRRFARQCPALGGPVTRALFSTATPPRTHALPIGVWYHQPVVPSGHLHGTVAGDTFAVVPLAAMARPIAPRDAPTAPLDAPAADPARPIAIATAVKVGAVRSTIALDQWTIDPPVLTAGAIAQPLTRHLPRVPVRIDGAGPAADRLRAWIAATPRLRLAAADDDLPPPAWVRVDGGAATVGDAVGPLADPIAISGPDADDALAAIAATLVELAVAAALRTLESAPGPPAEAAALSWGTVRDGALQPQPADGAVLSLADRVYLRIDNRSAETVYVHAFNLGVRNEVVRLTTSTTTGVELPPGAGHTIGDTGLPPGLGLAWTDGVPRTAPRRDELIVIATATPVDLGVLETAQRAARIALPADASPLQQLCTQVHLGGPRSAAPITDGYAVARCGFWLDPAAARAS